MSNRRDSPGNSQSPQLDDRTQDQNNEPESGDEQKITNDDSLIVMKKGKERETRYPPDIDRESKEKAKANKKPTLAETRARRRLELTQHLQTNTDLDGQPGHQKRQEPPRKDPTTAIALSDTIGVSINDKESDHVAQRTLAPTLAKKRMKKAKEIEESLVPLESDGEFQERLAKLNINIDESARIFRKTLYDMYLNKVSFAQFHVFLLS